MKVTDRTTMMVALDLALDVAWFSDDPRDLAVAAEAYTLVGFHDGAIMVSANVTHDATMRRVAEARRGRPKRLLRADARGMVTGLQMLIDAGLVDQRNASEARRQRWVARGGHDQ